MTLQQWLQHAAKQIPSSSPMLDAELLLCQHLGQSRAYLRTYPDKELTTSFLQPLNTELNRLATGYPLAYLLGEKDFWDMTLQVSEATLIPRADTETLLTVLQQCYPSKQAFSVIDLGTGSGAIAIAITRIFPNAQVTATDISLPALDIAKQNTKQWANSDIQFQCTSWLDNCPPNSVDCIISNPPYIEETDPHLSALQYEPITALTAGEAGLADLRSIIHQSSACLKPNGWLLLEHGYNQAQAVQNLFTETRQWQSIQTHLDLAQHQRVSIAQLCNK